MIGLLRMAIRGEKKMVHLRGKLLPALTISSHLNIGRDGEVLIEADHRIV
jgi:hypothetical protein